MTPFLENIKELQLSDNIKRRLFFALLKEKKVLLNGVYEYKISDLLDEEYDFKIPDLKLYNMLTECYERKKSISCDIKLDNGCYYLQPFSIYFSGFQLYPLLEYDVGALDLIPNMLDNIKIKSSNINNGRQMSVESSIPNSLKIGGGAIGSLYIKQMTEIIKNHYPEILTNSSWRIYSSHIEEKFTKRVKEMIALEEEDKYKYLSGAVKINQDYYDL